MTRTPPSVAEAGRRLQASMSDAAAALRTFAAAAEEAARRDSARRRQLRAQYVRRGVDDAELAASLRAFVSAYRARYDERTGR